MGTKIFDFDTINIGKNTFKIELNEGNKKEKYNIHIQDERFKLCYREEEFSILATNFMCALKKFNHLKGRENE